MSHVDILVVGSGPAGMAAAIEARQHGLTVLVIDDQPSLGGQIWRSVETSVQRDDILGRAYVEGRSVAQTLRDCGAEYQPESRLWRLDPGFRAFVSRRGATVVVDAKFVVLATGAQERPVPFPGWTLPGVLTVGAAQILLKNAGEVPTDPVWIAGSGPLPLLYAVQLLRAGGTIAGFLDTAPRKQLWSALAHLPRALRSIGHLLKGIGWQLKLRLAKVPVFRNVTEIEVQGEGRVEELQFRAQGKGSKCVPASVVLVHEGVVPSIHVAASLECKMRWSHEQECYAPVLDCWGESSQVGLFIAGDGAGIAGAKAALHRGTLCALGIAVKLRRIEERQAEIQAKTARTLLHRELAIRPFLDALYRPRQEVFSPSDETIVCRCEEITAGEIRIFAVLGNPGPNQIKAATRAGMGPCQGRLCGYTINRLLATAQDRTPEQVGFYNIRSPLKPVTLGEVAALDSSNPPFKSGRD